MVGCAKVEDLQGYIPLLVGIHCKRPFPCIMTVSVFPMPVLPSCFHIQMDVWREGKTMCSPLSLLFALTPCLDSARRTPMSIRTEIMKWVSSVREGLYHWPRP